MDLTFYWHSVQFTVFVCVCLYIHFRRVDIRFRSVLSNGINCTVCARAL